MTDQRIPLLDSLRGFAILLMAAYHFCFDLSHFGLLDADLALGWWPWLRALIVTLFLLLVGAGLFLGGASLTSARFLRRLLTLLLCAGFMSAVTYVLFGEAWVRFGILHFILTACLLGPALIRFPRLALPLGLAIVLLPLALESGSAPFLLGLSPEKHHTVDFTPLFPWLGVVLLGVFSGWAIRARPHSFLARELPALSWLGRHALAFYMLHQAVLFPLAWLLAKLAGSGA